MGGYRCLGWSGRLSELSVGCLYPPWKGGYSPAWGFNPRWGGWRAVGNRGGGGSGGRRGSRRGDRGSGGSGGRIGGNAHLVGVGKGGPPLPGIGGGAGA